MSIQTMTIALKKSKGGVKNHSAWFAWVLLTPGLVLLLMWSYFPSIYAFWLGFTNASPGNSGKFIGFQNYVQLMSGPGFWDSVYRSLEYLIVVPVLMIVPLLAAVLMNQKLPLTTLFRGIFFVPVVISMVVVGIVFNELFSTTGFLNDVMYSLKLVNTPVPFLSSKNIAIFSVMFVTVWKGIGYYMIIYLAGLQSIPEELYDAAALDGATFLQRVRYVVIPSIWPFMIYVMIASTLSAMSVFTEIYTLTGGGPLQSTTTMLVYVYQQAFSQYKFGFSAAAGNFIWLILIIISLAQFWISSRRYSK
ncbi:sugar ABC transporter permease [Alicyclobacillus fastidiosus]|uniref:Sugar ABC transporter permease n=1 Tax=Alicyclobacillus fastidiosus TaxID=392011 RepID=A0ABY6ZEM5_9BACL|nr:sugar ABC transporter permease [Alicyclobacillus fastidiosus]WAH41297.1 sugar ABC transporter permease [Alicyclobacillus fastidiosus]GMA62898.1 sugar ABC transporter permease [Alicyclobacillus fastidiosus]